MYGTYPGARTRRLLIGGAAAAIMTFAASHAIGEPCSAPAFHKAAAKNAISLTHYKGPVYSVIETGWQTYVPQIQNSLDTACAPDSEGFAQEIASFQKNAGVQATGIVDRATLVAFRRRWQSARTLYNLAARSPCPFTGRNDLVRIAPEYDLGANDPRLAAEAYTAWKRMRDAAVADGIIADTSDVLKIVAAYRSPERAAELKRRNPNSAAQGLCSVHISGFAVDLNVGHAPGFDPISSKPANRLWQSQQPVYRWLVANAGRFGFVNYVYEPWHWEYAGTTP